MLSRVSGAPVSRETSPRETGDKNLHAPSIEAVDKRLACEGGERLRRRMDDSACVADYSRASSGSCALRAARGLPWSGSGVDCLEFVVAGRTTEHAGVAYLA